MISSVVIVCYVVLIGIAIAAECSHGKKRRALYTIAFGGLVVFLVFVGIEISKGLKADNQLGFHCLSDWDGTHTAFKNHVRSGMFDPDSFQHIKTLVGPEVNGQHTISMEFRLRDRFGVIDIIQARGHYRNDGCKHTLSGLVSMTAP